MNNACLIEAKEGKQLDLMKISLKSNHLIVLFFELIRKITLNYIYVSLHILAQKTVIQFSRSKHKDRWIDHETDQY